MDLLKWQPGQLAIRGAGRGQLEDAGRKRAVDGRDVYLVYTRWASQADFDAWVQSPAFAHGHRAHHGEGPVSNQSELWSYDVVQSEGPSGS